MQSLRLKVRSAQSMVALVWDPMALGAQSLAQQIPGGKVAFTKVIDLVGNSSKQPGYTAETLQCIFSSGKNMEVVVLAMVVDRDLVNYNDAVSKHWTGLKKHGKEAVTLVDVMRNKANQGIQRPR